MKFTKMHGIGNDYIYVDCFEEPDERDWNRLAISISDRHFGVGSDGLILLTDSDAADFGMRMFNADGSEGDMCGNGIRCLAKLAYDRGHTNKTSFAVETRAGIMRPELFVENGAVQSIRVNMGPPSLRTKDVPMLTDSMADAIDVPVEACGSVFRVTGVRMGNPNGVIFVDCLDEIDLAVLGPALEAHKVFPQKANIEFARIKDSHHIDMRVWERGSGITLACGTGACACLVAAAATGRSSRTAELSLPGGKLFIEWAEAGDVYMTGPAETICTGEYLKESYLLKP